MRIVALTLLLAAAACAPSTDALSDGPSTPEVDHQVVRASLAGSCDAGDANADVAGSTCRVGCLLPSCGDGVLDRGEACDQGAANSDSEPDACRTTCVLAACGDGVVDRGESCDGDAACSAQCTLPPPTARERATQATPVHALEGDATEGCSVATRAQSAPWTWLLLLALLVRCRRH